MNWEKLISRISETVWVSTHKEDGILFVYAKNTRDILSVDLVDIIEKENEIIEIAGFKLHNASELDIGWFEFEYRIDPKFIA